MPWNCIVYTDNGTHDADEKNCLKSRLNTESVEDDDFVTRDEIEQAISRLKDWKSPGVDGIPAELIKAGGLTLINEIHRLCNMTWQKKQWPDKWTKSTLITTPKKRDCANYRRIVAGSS